MNAISPSDKQKVKNGMENITMDNELRTAGILLSVRLARRMENCRAEIPCEGPPCICFECLCDKQVFLNFNDISAICAPKKGSTPAEL